MPGWATNNESDYFAIAVQSAKDTEGSSFIFLKHGDGTALDGDDDVVSEREGGDGQEVGLRYKSLVKLDGQIAANSRGDLNLVALTGILGKTARQSDASIAGGIPSTCKLYELVPNATLPYFTAEQRFADNIERGTNMKFTQVDVEGEAGRAARITAQVVGGGTHYRRAIASTLTAARESTDPIYFPRGSYQIDGAGNTKVTKFKLSMKRTVDDSIQTTELWREDVIELNADYDLDLTLKYEDATLYNKIRYGGGTMVPLTLATGAFRAFMTNAAAGTMLRSVDLSLPLIQYAGAKVNKLDPDGKTVYIDVAAMTIKSATSSVVAGVVAGSRAALV